MSQPRPSLLAPASSAIAIDGLTRAEVRGMLFSHRYEPPRGEEGAPLAALPIWFPVAAPPMETLTLAQVLYRSLGSVRKPFRRTRLLLRDADRVRTTYTELLDWAGEWAGSNLGASLIPVALSLSRLATHLAQRQLPAAGCREILELGAALPGAAVEDLADAVEAGNAWILLEDDCNGSEDLAPVKKALDAVFGPEGLVDVAIVLLTARKGCDVLSDVQTFWEPREEEQPEARRRGGAGALAAALCRLLSRLGSPATKPSLLAAAALGIGLIALVLLRYEELLGLPSYFTRAHPLRAVALWLGLLSPMIAGYIWGLFWGSEEVRRSSVIEMILSLLAFGSVFLVALPRSMDPGLLKSACIFLASLPAAVLVSLSVLGALSLAANILWLILSVRLCRRLGAEGLAALALRYRLVLHVAHFSAMVPLPHGWSARAGFPLLVCFRNHRILAGLLPTFPSLAPQLRTVILTGIRRDPGPYSLSAASLALEGLVEEEDELCRSCLRNVASGCAAAWPRRHEFDEYRQPSTTFTMNALEYLARRLCYLTNLEELIVVR